MYLSFTALTALSILSAGALAAPADFTFDLSTRQAATNTPSEPGFMTGTNQTFSAWTRSGCGNNTDDHDNIWFPNVLYGKNNHALVVSFMLGRDMNDNERLDMSFAYADGHQVVAADGTPEDFECSLFQYTASPDQSNKANLLANQCYTASAPVTCFNMWKTS